PGEVDAIGHLGDATVTSQAKAVIDTALARKLPMMLEPGTYLLAAGPRNAPLSRRQIERLTRMWGKAAQVAACQPHRFRHPFATGLLEAGVDIRIIQEAMGHRDIQSTMVYTQVTDAALDAAIAKLPWGTAAVNGL